VNLCPIAGVDLNLHVTDRQYIAVIVLTRTYDEKKKSGSAATFLYLVLSARRAVNQTNQLELQPRTHCAVMVHIGHASGNENI